MRTKKQMITGQGRKDSPVLSVTGHIPAQCDSLPSAIIHTIIMNTH